MAQTSGWTREPVKNSPVWPLVPDSAPSWHWGGCDSVEIWFGDEIQWHMWRIKKHPRTIIIASPAVQVDVHSGRVGVWHPWLPSYTLSPHGLWDRFGALCLPHPRAGSTIFKVVDEIMFRMQEDQDSHLFSNSQIT
jgi:hypothetical protein